MSIAVLPFAPFVHVFSLRLAGGEILIEARNKSSDSNY